jgi:hypothetical protein
MTKGGGFPFGSRGDDRANFHLRIVDDDAINEQCDQWSALDKRQRVQSWLHALTKCFDSLGQGCDIDVLLGLGIEWPQLLPEAMLTLSHLLASARKLLALDHLREV